MTLLPVQAAHALPQLPEDGRWLIDGLWGDQAVGIVGGEPKCCKSFLALDMAVAVAAGVPCLRRYSVVRPGRVLLFAAEDALHIVRARLEGIGRAAGISLADLQQVGQGLCFVDLLRMKLHPKGRGDAHPRQFSRNFRRIGAGDAVPALIAALHDRDTVVRESVAEALDAIGTPEARRAAAAHRRAGSPP